LMEVAAPDHAGSHIIACATVAEELRHMGVAEERLTILEFGLHEDPEKLKVTLQDAIDAVPGDCDVLLGYGLCSNAAVGLRGGAHRLVIPRIDDCIALFLGSRAEQARRMAEEPGTYYLTKGWVEAGEGTLREYARLVERYGETRAMRVAKAVYANYTRVALINTGNYRIDDYRAYALAMADFLELEFVELPGSNRMLEMMLSGDWGEEFVVVEPGGEVPAEEFYAH